MHTAQLETNKSLQVRKKGSEQSGTENSPSQDKREEMLLLQASFTQELGFLVAFRFFPPSPFSEFSGIAALTALETGKGAAHGDLGNLGFWHRICECSISFAVPLPSILSVLAC